MTVRVSPTQAPADAAANTKQGTMTFIVKNVDFNVANSDTAIPIVLPTGFTRYRVLAVRLSGASANISTATCGVFTAAAGGGVAAIVNPTTITVASAAENTNTNAQNINGANQNTMSLNALTLYFRVLTAQGSAGTANVAIVIEPLS